MEIKDYKIIKPLEKTNHAEIYKVRTKLNKICALKIARAPDFELNGLIASEFHILSQFIHRNIVKVLDYGITEQKRAYFTSEFISGMPINKFFKGYSRGFINTVLEVLDALVLFHNRGYIHSDLKPAHILYISKRKMPVLIDFGFASILNEWQVPRGTFGYIAPEVLKGSGLDQRSDLYSLGVIMYEILSATSDRSLEADKQRNKYQGFDTKFLIPSRKINPNIPEEINDIVFRLLATEPALRPTAGDVYETLAKFSSKKGTKKARVRISLPQLYFLDICKIKSQLGNVKNISGKTHVISGDRGIGKTRILNELRYEYLLSKNNVILFSTEKPKRLFDAISEYIGFRMSDKKIKDKLAVFEELTEALKTIVKDRKKHLVIMVDDLDELDEFDQSLYRYIGFSIRDSKIVLIATSRPCSEIEKTGFENLQLRSFTYDEVRELARKTFNITDKDKSSDWLYHASGGNPFFIEEIIKLLFQRSLFYYKENKWHFKSGAFVEANYPENIEDIIIHKIKDLDNSCAKILQILSLYNNPMEPMILTEIAGLQSFERVEYLMKIGLVKISQLKNRLAYVIASNAISEVVKQNISDKKRLRLFKKFFRVTKKNFEASPEYIPYIAEYAEACDDAQNAYDYSLKAVELEQNMYDFQKAIKFLRKAVKYATKIAPDNLVCLLMRIGKLEYRLGNTNEAIDTYINALKYADDDLKKSEIFYNIGLIHQKKGKYEDAIEYFNKSVSLIKETNTNYVNILNNLSYSLIYSERLTDAQSLLKECLCITEKTKATELKAKILYCLAVLEWFRNDYNKGIEITRNALRIIQNNNDLNLVSKCYNLLGSLYQQEGNLERAEKSYNSAIQLFQSLKEINSLASALINLALIVKSQCKFKKANQLLWSALNYARKAGNNREISRVLVNLANVYEIKGDFDKAIELNKQAMNTYPTAVHPGYNLSMLYCKKGQIEIAKKILKNALDVSDDPLNYFGLASINVLSGKIVKAESNMKKGFRTMRIGKIDFFKKIACYMKNIEICYDIKRYEKCYSCAIEVLKFLTSGSREYVIVDAISKISGFLAGKIEKPDILSNLIWLKKLDCLFDWAYLKRMELEALYEKGLEDMSTSNIHELYTAEEIFKNFDAKIELNRIQEIKDQILKGILKPEIEKSISIEYLKIFRCISETINNYLGEDDFADRILDILISTTQAESGALFLIEEAKIKLATGRNVDHQTITDAKKVSQTVVRKTGRHGKIIYSSDALSDTRFKNSKSVILNRIRSLVCAPLTVGTNIIGAIYLDSRHTYNLFSEEDRNFLLTVANFVASTIEKSKVFQKIKKENIFLRMQTFAESANEYLIGESSAIQEIRDMIEKVAVTDATVLVTGETGCGKGIVARLIHQKSMRKNGRFVLVNCGNLPETLFESELFGYKKGAFTGAYGNKKGLFEEANCGTLFLDEISNTPLATQGKFLEAIEEKTMRRLGETTVRKVDVRLISATNQNLEELIKQNLFRNDLFYRISVLTIHMPPLRERPIDIPLLADYFLKKYAYQMNRNIFGFDKRASKMMLLYSWPGNVRELLNAIERAIIFAQDQYILPDNLKLQMGIAKPSKPRQGNGAKIISVLKAAKGNISLAARLLGVTRVTMYNYIKKYKIKISKNHQ